MRPSPIPCTRSGSVFPSPLTHTSDQGGQFLTGCVKGIRIATYHPQLNDLIERLHRRSRSQWSAIATFLGCSYYRQFSTLLTAFKLRKLRCYLEWSSESQVNFFLCRNTKSRILGRSWKTHITSLISLHQHPNMSRPWSRFLSRILRIRAYVFNRAKLIRKPLE